MATTHSDLLLAKAALSRRYLTKAVPSAISTFALAAPRKTSQNVVGVGVGTKFTDDKETGTKCVRFYVAQKIGKAALSASELLPTDVDGIPTDVIVTGKFRMLDTTAADNKKRRRPVRPGTSIGFRFPPPKDNWVMAGTFGAVVSKGGKRYVLSNNHVLAENGLIALGAPIFQPGLLDGGTANDQIAKLTRFIQIKGTGFNKVDCAIAEFLATTKVNPHAMPKVGKLKSASPVAATVGMQVEKTGRTTGYTRGNVFDIAADVNVEYEDKNGNPFVASFANQMLVNSSPGVFSAAGDSGSLIVARPSKRATGLLFAGSSTYTIGNHIDKVLAALGVTLVP